MDADVIIVGSGPAGATAATLLAQYGHRVLMIERGKHPRFHIGESLLPRGTLVLKRLGIALDDTHYLPKFGAEFIDERSGQQCRFALAGQYQPHQVERAKFDLMMVENAIKNGAKIRQQEKVKAVEVDRQGVQIVTDQGILRARYAIDASGRSALFGRMHNSISRIDKLGQFSLYTHYRNASSAAAQKAYQTGDVKVLMLDIGWFWIIPLIGLRMSIGMVIKEGARTRYRGAELYEHYRAASPLLNALLEGAEQQTDIQAEADFSFKNEKRYGVRYACCGDAAGFLDPVFSSGVFMAITSAERIADRVHQALATNTEAEPNLHARDDEDYEFGFRSMQLFVERFYQYDLVHHLFFEATRDSAIKSQIAGLLAGDLWSGNNPFQQKLMAGRQNRATNDRGREA